jgi:hypothetical protein
MKPIPLPPNPKLIDRIEYGLQWALSWLIIYIPDHPMVSGLCTGGSHDRADIRHRGLAAHSNGTLEMTAASAPSPPLIPFVPRDFLIAPVFTATPQTEPRTLVINSVKWTIGDEHPIKRHPTPALDMRHGRACFTLLSFRDRLTNERDIHFSMNEFCHRYANSQGGRYSRKILSILFDLHETWISRELPDGKTERFAIIEGNQTGAGSSCAPPRCSRRSTRGRRTA